MTTKDKINEALGLSGGKSIDEMLNDMSLDAKDDLDKIDELSESISSEMQKVDIQLAECNGQTPVLNISSINASMKEVEGLIMQSKEIFKHIADNIMSSELLDSELIHSAAAFLESLHVNISEFISLYRDKQKYVDKIRTMLLQNNLRKELMDLKHQHDIELLKLKETSGAVDVEGSAAGPGMSQEDITKMLSKMSSAQLDEIAGSAFSEDLTEKDETGKQTQEN